MRALQIYLDSSDYSNLSNPHMSDGLLPISRQLREWVDDGVIEIRYSWSHIVELLHKEPAYIRAAVARAEMLSDLCRGRTLIYFTELFSREATNVLRPGTLPTPDFAYDADDRYFPPNLIDDDEIHNLPRDALLEAIEPLGRSQKRFLKKKYLSGTRLSAEGKEFMRNLTLTSNVRGSLPGDLWSSGRLQEVLFGNNPRKGDQLVQEFFHPRRLVETYIDLHSSGRAIRDALARPAGKLIDAMRRARSLLTEFASRLPDDAHEHAEKLIDSFGSIRQSTIRSLVDQNYAALTVTGLAPEVVRTELVRSSFGSLPGLDMMLFAAKAWASTAIMNLTNPRTLKASDFGDITHATYIPYVDLWRGDKYMTHELKRAASTVGCTVVNSLGDLVTCIEQKVRANT